MTLIDVLCHYHQLAARRSRSTWGTELTTGACPVCANPGGKLCNHRSPDLVAEGKRFLKAISQPTEDEVLQLIALRVDVDRQIDSLRSPMARELFHLRYRTLVVDPETQRKRQPTLAEVRVKLCRPWDDVIQCHGLHLDRMEGNLRNWFPAAALAA